MVLGMIRAVVFDVGGCLVDESREYGTWAGLHFHDLRHTGNQFVANSGAGLRDLMALMGHDSTRAAMTYQHVAQGADKAITDAIDRHVDDERGRGGEGDDDGPAGIPVPA